jgi:catechol 2,3-dioxygenase-like lactoylglutathione lyase family enzyme
MSAPDGVAGLEHVLVLSDDIDRAAQFYVQALGLEIGARPPLQFTGYWLYAGQTPCLHIGERDSYRTHVAKLGLDVSRTADGRGPVDHIAFGAVDYGAASERLARAGVEPVHNQVPGGGPRQLFFDDPDGVRVEINVRAKS